MAGIPWTKQEEDMLIKLAKAGCKMEEVLLVFPYRTLHAIGNKSKTLRLSLAGKNPEPNFEAFKNLLKKGEQKCV